jgi:hypothetical protein
MVPLPEPLLVLVIHETEGKALQVHPLGAVTLAVPAPPAAGADADEGDIVYVQVGLAGATVN